MNADCVAVPYPRCRPNPGRYLWSSLGQEGPSLLALVPFRPCRSTPGIRAPTPGGFTATRTRGGIRRWPGPSIRSRGLMTTVPCWPTAATREHRIPGSGLTRARVHREPCLHQQYQWVLDRDIRALPTQRPPSPPPPSSTRIRAARASIRWATSADSRIRLWNAPPLGRSLPSVRAHLRICPASAKWALSCLGHFGTDFPALEGPIRIRTVLFQRAQLEADRG